MTTSGSWSFSVNRDDVIKTAMQFIGKIGENELPTATETSDLARILNMLVKQWQGKTDFATGLKTWTRRTGYLFLNNSTGQYSVGPTATGWTNSFVNPLTTAGAALGASTITVSSATGIVIGYTIGVEYGTNSILWTTVSNVVGTTITLNTTLPGASASGSEVYCYQTTAQQPQHIEAAVLRDSNNQDTPLNLMTVQTWAYLPNKVDPTNIADPTAIYYEFQLGNSILYTDCGAANDVSKYIVLTYLEAIQDFNNPLDTPEYPQEWFLALCWGLAAQSAPLFNVPWEQSMEVRYKEALAIAQNKGPERQAIFFQPGED
jgi:hypothetical protein